MSVFQMYPLPSQVKSGTLEIVRCPVSPGLEQAEVANVTAREGVDYQEDVYRVTEMNDTGSIYCMLPLCELASLPLTSSRVNAVSSHVPPCFWRAWMLKLSLLSPFSLSLSPYPSPSHFDSSRSGTVKQSEPAIPAHLPVARLHPRPFVGSPSAAAPALPSPTFVVPAQPASDQARPSPVPSATS